jgi:hypothetical protein
MVEVPPTRYLAIDGEGDPNTSPPIRPLSRRCVRERPAIRFMIENGRRDT